MSERYATVLPGSAVDQDCKIWALDKDDVPAAMRMLERAGADLDTETLSEGLADVRPPELPDETLELMDEQDRRNYQQEREVLTSDEYDLATLRQ